MGEQPITMLGACRQGDFQPGFQIKGRRGREVRPKPRRASRTPWFPFVIALCGALIGHALIGGGTPQRNVLFIISDDLNTMLGCYGDSVAQTPNLDKLAARGTRFDRAYCTFPLCGPSRTSMLTGLYPNSTGIFGNPHIFRQTIPSQISLPQAFRRQGYRAIRLGKIFHYAVPDAIGTDGHDDPASWESKFNPAGVDWLEEEARLFRLTPGGGTLSWYASAAGDDRHTDGMLASEAEEILERCARQKERPFFLAVGFFRPHTPFVVPRPYFDRYPKPAMRIVSGVEADRADVPAAALSSKRSVQEALTDDLRREALQAYYASISFMDAQVGRVVNALDRHGLSDNTVIVFTSDHGYHTGEHGLWMKMSLFEESTRVPLLIVAPGVAQPATVVNTPVSLIDLYPTLVELTGVRTSARLQGQSLIPMLENFRAKGRGWALTQVRREGPGAAFFGYSLRTARWRYTEWDETRQGRELYDHAIDARELNNLATLSSHQGVVQELAENLHTAKKSTFPADGRTPEIRDGLWFPVLAPND